MYRITVPILAILLFVFRLGFADYCSICVHDYCQTTYPYEENDLDGDGMSDDYEMQLAIQFKPTLLLDNWDSEIPFVIPGHYDTPPYSYESGENHGLPLDIVSNGTIYVHVLPCDVIEPGKSKYIEVAYWFYYTYNQAECDAGYIGEHGHDWEHIALCLAVPPSGGPLQVVALFFAHHKEWEFLKPNDAQWTGTPGLSSVKVYVPNGSHASYPGGGVRCSYHAPITHDCLCHETPNANYQLTIQDSMILPLYELGDPRAPGWLDYSGKWRGDIGSFGELPYGPARGDHALWWDGHFISPPYCIVKWLVSVPMPTAFEVSNTVNGQPIYNSLYLTWEDPVGQGDIDSFVIMRKKGFADYSDSGYVCLARLDTSVHEYLDDGYNGCLDGGYYSYKLVSYHYHPDPLYDGCSEPAQATAYSNGGECPYEPNAPQIYSCDSCILKWNDRSYNEDGFTIIFAGSDTAGQVGPDTTRLYLTNCNTVKHGYKVCAYNEQGQNCTPSVSVNSSIEIVYPNGAEELIPGDFQDIEWTRYIFYGPVKLEYTTDDGVNWLTIADTTENDGFYYWEVPENPSSLCRVRIYDVVDSMPLDSSDNCFTICNSGICVVDPTSLDFGTVDLGDSAQMSFTIENTGCGTINGVITDCSPEFSVSHSSYHVEPNQSATLTVTFKPERGWRDCTIDNHGGVCSNVYCYGYGQQENGGGGGGCPFLYVWNGIEFEEDNTILAACEINPEQHITDYYMLSKTLVPANDEYRLQIREFENQVSYLDRVKLIAVDHTPEIKVAVTPEGRIFGYDKELIPIACVDQKGRDHLSKIRRKDGYYFKSDEPGYMIVTYSTRTVWPNVLYDPPPIEPEVAIPPWQKRTGIVSHVVVEVQDIHGEWHTAGDVPPRFHPERSYWIVGTGDLELGQEVKVKLSWDAYYAADVL
ncbi:MAG: hypothetical protein WBD28_01350, partial [Candidatus Zixiibacteriota bacterium]